MHRGHFHQPKQRVLGLPQVPPAWRTNAANGSGSTSKILLSKLPLDVDEREVEVRTNPNG